MLARPCLFFCRTNRSASALYARAGSGGSTLTTALDDDAWDKTRSLLAGNHVTAAAEVVMGCLPRHSIGHRIGHRWYHVRAHHCNKPLMVLNTLIK